ncbi:hypothetical protein [Chryseobacterium wanjuense]
MFSYAEINAYETIPEKGYTKTFAELTNSDNHTIIQSETRRTQISIAKNIAIIILTAALVALFFYCKSKQKKQFSKFRNIIRNQYSQINKKYDSKIGNEILEPDFSNISVEEVFEKKMIIKKE